MFPFFMDLDKFRDGGLLWLRLVIGLLMAYYGFNKLLGGPETWEGVGGAMSNFGITFAPAFWGLCAALTEAFGGLALALGLLTRLTVLPLAFTMIVAISTKFAGGEGFSGAAYPLTMFVIFTSLFFTGPGKFSLDAKFSGKNK